MVGKVILSKSRFLAGLQCPKYLWYLVNERERIPEPDFVTNFIFNQGIKVGEYAKKLYPDGVDLSDIKNLKEQIIKTREVLPERKPVFEAGCSYDTLYSRADILEPVDGGRWDIIEVKSSAQLKEEYISDVSFQKYCFEKAGISIRNCLVAHINNVYIKRGDIDPEGLFKKVDITAEVDERLTGIEDEIRRMLEVVKRSTPPEVEIGRQCHEPYICPLKQKCWEGLPENHVFNLYGDKSKSAQLYSEGIFSIKDIPDRYNLSLKQKIQLECERTKKPSINKKEISKFINGLKFPLYFLDFETFSTAIPLFDGTKPYQKMPFQYSIHLLYSMDGNPEHRGFLAGGLEDPRRVLLSRLKEDLGDEGSIIVYYEQFEKDVLRELASEFPGYGEWVDRVLLRIVDLYKPFGNFYYYNSSQRGSASVKSVLPAITNLSYEGMEIANGLAASAYFLYIYGDFYNLKKPPGAKEVERIRKALIEYCRMDTVGMVYILRSLAKEAGQL
jgi:CRISPR/Cas system-associated exonuclease Cas4 (RecB family)